MNFSKNVSVIFCLNTVLTFFSNSTVYAVKNVCPTEKFFSYYSCTSRDYLVQINYDWLKENLAILQDRSFNFYWPTLEQGCAKGKKVLAKSFKELEKSLEAKMNEERGKNFYSQDSIFASQQGKNYFCLLLNLYSVGLMLDLYPPAEKEEKEASVDLMEIFLQPR